MKYIQLMILIVLASCSLNTSSTNSTGTGLMKVYFEGIRRPKQEILRTANSVKATREEKATLLAVASIETENMSVDYPKGDGKAGDAYNVSIYKMNLGMVRNIDPTANLYKLHLDNAQATRIMLKGLRKYGTETFLRYHRAGKGNIPEKEIKPYLNAIKIISEAYLSDEKQLNVKTTDNYRYTILVPAI